MLEHLGMGVLMLAKYISNLGAFFHWCQNDGVMLANYISSPGAFLNKATNLYL